MAEQAKDGSLIFDTKIDTTGFEKDIEKLGKTELDLNVNVDTTVVKETFESFGTSAVTLDLSTTAAVQQYRETVASMEQREIETKITLNVESVEDAINAYEPPTKELAIDVAVDDIEEPLGKLFEGIQNIHTMMTALSNGSREATTAAIESADQMNANAVASKQALIEYGATFLETAKEMAAAKTAVTADAQTILTDMTTFITALGVDVAAMVQTMNDLVADGEIGAAEAGKAFAQGAARGYRAETPLRDAVEEIIRQAISHMNGFLQAFCGVGASMVQSIADGVSAEGGVLQSAMRGVVANALAAAQNAMGSAVSLGRVNRWYPKRTGLEYVPYDEYPALLHKGESVLTAAEAALWRGGQTAVRESAAASAVLDYHALASAIWEAAPEGQAPVIALDGAVVGRMVEPYVSSLQGDRVKSGRFG